MMKQFSSKIVILIISLILIGCSSGSGKSTPEYPESSKDLVRQHQSDQQHHIGVIVGDSMVQMPALLPETGDWSGLLEGDVFNGGIGGDTSKNMLDRFNIYLDMEPDFILLMSSTNDCWSSFNYSTFNNIKTMTEIALEDGVDLILVQPPFPSAYQTGINFQCLNEQRQAMFDLSKERNLEIIDLSSELSPNGYLLDEYTRADVGDYMHPNADAYFEASHLIRPYIENYLD